MGSIAEPFRCNLVALGFLRYGAVSLQYAERRCCRWIYRQPQLLSLSNFITAPAFAWLRATNGESKRVHHSREVLLMEITRLVCRCSAKRRCRWTRGRWNTSGLRLPHGRGPGSTEPRTSN